jgi:transaldolase
MGAEGVLCNHTLLFKVQRSRMRARHRAGAAIHTTFFDRGPDRLDARPGAAAQPRADVLVARCLQAL